MGSEQAIRQNLALGYARSVADGQAAVRGEEARPLRELWDVYDAGFSPAL
jgi:hypothetical protein